MILRTSAGDRTAAAELNKKFGSDTDTATKLLKLSAELGVKTIGIWYDSEVL